MIENEQEFITNSFEETQKIGENFVQKLENRNVIALYGELGSGKTTFAQGLARGLGIKQRIISPTFIIVRTYKIRFKIYDLRFKNFYHIDLYRIENIDDVQGLGLEEILKDPQNVVVIEWAEKIKDLLPKKRWDIKFEYINDSNRKIILTKVNQ